MSADVTRTWAGSPSRIATREGPWDSPAVSQRSMGPVFHPGRGAPDAGQPRRRDRRADQRGPTATPSRAPTSMNGPNGYARREQRAGPAARRRSSSPGSAEDQEAGVQPDGELAPADVAEREAEQRGQPDVAEAHARGVDEPQQPVDRPGDRPGRSRPRTRSSWSPATPSRRAASDDDVRRARAARSASAAAGCASRRRPARRRPAPAAAGRPAHQSRPDGGAHDRPDHGGGERRTARPGRAASATSAYGGLGSSPRHRLGRLRLRQPRGSAAAPAGRRDRPRARAAGDDLGRHAPASRRASSAASPAARITVERRRLAR